LTQTSWQLAVGRALGVIGAPDWRCVAVSDWGSSWSLRTHAMRYFVKAATGDHADMAPAEADGLRALAGASAIRVPDVIAEGSREGTAFLALSWLDIEPRRDGAALGRALAALHRAKPPIGVGGDRFGWRRGNWIGGTPQTNGWSDDWCAFFRDRRLAPQFALAAKRGHPIEREGERLRAALPSLLRGHDPAPSLLHGDLWSGNAGTLAGSEPVIFDPAVYVGDREADLAMTELFGGFDAEFYRAYNDAWKVDVGYPLRRRLYNLYHLLNHLNLFGAAYLERVTKSVSALLAETRR
jgi:protein-ribulosamine 3-kinase